MKNKPKIISYTLLVLWCLVIFYLSHQTADVSGSNSLNILSRVFSWLSDDTLVSLNAIFREVMHAAVFGVLGIFTYISFRYTFKNAFLSSMLFCSLYALSDEIHQLFVDGRAFEIVDLAVDIYGAMTGIALTKLVFILFIDSDNEY